MPQDVVFVPTLNSKKTGLQLFEAGAIDFLSNLDQTDISERLDRYTNSDVATLSSTLPVRLELIVFTSLGLKLPPERRWAIGNKIAAILNHQYAGKTGFQPAVQYFPDGGAGNLPDDSLKEIRTARAKLTPDSETGNGLKLGAFPRNFDRMEKILRLALPEIELTELRGIPTYDPEPNKTEYPHLYIVSMDTGFLEDLPNVVNSVKSGFLGLSDEQRNEWLSRYIGEQDESLRIQALKKIHLESLRAPLIIPIARTPYVSLLRKPWINNFSYLFPNCPIWKISID